MDRLIADIETEKEVVIEEKTQVQEKTFGELKKEEETPIVKSYLNSFENKTIADLKKEEEEKRAEEFKGQKEQLIQEQYSSIKKQEEKREASQNIIEKPNYDFIEENKKVVKLNKKQKTKKENKKKLAGVVVACALGASALICVTNAAVIENMNSNYIQIDDTYNFNLRKYLDNIRDLDTTKKSMEMIETYPEEILDAGDLGKQSNWFDKLCSFLEGLFGG